MILLYLDGLDALLESLCRGCGGILEYVIEAIIVVLILTPFVGIILLFRWIVLGNKKK